MSQNDFVIANANGATVRSDINSALQALASLSSGTSAPSTTYANQLWHDETNDLLKMRDEANTSWITIASKVGTTWIPYRDGTAIGTIATLAYAGINQNLTMSAKHVAFATTSVTSGTPDFATSGNVVTLSSTATANTLGTTQAGFIGIIHYGISITITHNATSRILPTGANIVTAAGDCEIVLSLGSGNWRTIAYMRASGAALVGAAASQATMEAASSTTDFTTPGRQHFHPAHPKAWFVSDQSSGTPSINGSHGISSLGDDGVGRVQVNLSTAMSSTAYGVGAFTYGTTTVPGYCSGLSTDTKSASALDFRTVRGTDAAIDCDNTSLIFVGDV